MSKRDGHQQGPQQHAEGGHGEKTHEAFIDQLAIPESAAPSREPHHTGDANVFGIPRQGKHRLDEGREQHDVADLAPELTKEESDDRGGRSRGG